MMVNHKCCQVYNVKQAQKRLELFLAREQRRPVEDMSIQDAKVCRN